MRFSNVLPFHRRREEKRKTEKETAENEKKKGAAAPQQKPLKGTVSNAPPTLSPISNDASTVEAGTEAPTQNLATEEEEVPTLNMSEQIWNRAFDQLADDMATSALVEGYVRILPKATNPDEDATGLAGDVMELQLPG